MAVLLPLSAFEMSADEKEARKIPISKSTDLTLQRERLELPIESYFIGMVNAIQTTVTFDLGTIEITVTNLSTGDTWTDIFDSAVTPHLLPISGASGIYKITYLTSFGDLYEGIFNIL